MKIKKIVTQTELLKIRKACKRKRQTFVFTNGCFDLLHRGHIEYLSKAKELGDILVIALNSDKSVKRLKGVGRPIIKLDDRAVIISHLDMVDYVTSFGSLTPKTLISKLIPDVLVKGGDYKKENIVGGNEVLENGGEVKVIKFVKGRSTSKLANIIKNLSG